MGKKRDNKTKTTVAVEDDVSSEASSATAVSDNVATNKKAKTNKKQKNHNDDADEIARELEEMKLEHEGNQDNKSSSNKSKKDKTNSSNGKMEVKKSKKKVVVESNSEEESESSEEEEVVQVKSKFSGFAALGDDDMMEDNSDEEGQDDSDGDSPSSPSPPPPPPPKQQQNNAKKANKKKKKDDDDGWDELDQILESKPASNNSEDNKGKPKTAAPAPKKDNKKKGKNKKKGAQDDNEDDFDAILAEARKADCVETPMEEDVKTETQEESKPKKQKKKKGKDPEENGVTEADDTTETPAADTTETPAAEVAATESMTPPQQGEDFPPADEAGQDDDDAAAQPQREKRKTKKQKQREAEAKAKADVEAGIVPETTDDKGKKGAKKNAPNKKLIAAMKEAQEILRQEEEERKRLEEEFMQQEDERIKAEEEKARLDAERKEKRKQRDKERKERLKAEGKFLTVKQKADQRRAQDMLESLKAQGISIPEVGEKKGAPRLGSKAYVKKKLQAKQEERAALEKQKEDSPPLLSAAPIARETKEASPPAVKEDDSVKDSWDISSDEEEENSTDSMKDVTTEADNTQQTQATAESSEADESEDDGKSTGSADEPVSLRDKVLARLKKRKEGHEAQRSLDKLRAPVVCVLGHVDHGKTKILDKLRRTNVQEGEVGGITQQIGATNVPADAITTMTKMIKTFDPENIKFPGLLIIDTPGHESFSNLRNRGSSMCDIAVLVVDVTQGLEPQTIESIELLKKRKTPFLVALNKVDRIFEWESNQHKDIRDVIKIQKETARSDFERRYTDIIVKLNEQSLNAALFWENPDPRSYVSLIPTSAITGDGMGNLISMICDMCQTRLAQQLRFSQELQCIVLEVKTIQGYGTTVDVILVNGTLNEGDTIVLAGTDGAIVTQIRSLLMPKPMREIRVKGSYDEFKSVTATQGIKLAAKDLEKAIAGLSLCVAKNEDEIELLKESVEKGLKEAMRSIKVKDKGVYVQASTLGALEALLEFFKTKSIPYSGIRVGPVVRRDVMKAAAMLEHDEKYAVILAFDVKVDRDAQELADKEGVKIFSEETIYHLGDRYVEYLEEHKRKKQNENRSLAVFPCKLKIIPESIFNKRDPIVLGVTVDQGILRTGTLLCVPGKEFVEIGVVTSMEFDHKVVDIAKKGVDVCIKIDPSQGTTPKLYGRHFEAPDEIVSKISRESINACKDFFRDDLSKADWKLMAELKKLFDIL